MIFLIPPKLLIIRGVKTYPNENILFIYTLLDQKIYFQSNHSHYIAILCVSVCKSVYYNVALIKYYWYFGGSPGGVSGKEPACKSRRHKRCGFDSWVGKILWRRAWQPTPVFLPGEFHGQRNLMGTFHRVAKSQTWLMQLSTHTTLIFLVCFWVMDHHKS